MKPIDFVILGLVLLGVGAAVFFVVRNRKKGGCCGDCSSCAACEKGRKNNG